jgi:hypothetical protein
VLNRNKFTNWEELFSKIVKIKKDH